MLADQIYLVLRAWELGCREVDVTYHVAMAEALRTGEKNDQHEWDGPQAAAAGEAS